MIRTYFLSILCSYLLSCSLMEARVFRQDWDIIPQEELDLKEPKIDPDADAEILFHGFYVDDSHTGFASKEKYYQRIKIFTQAGVEAQKKQVLKVYHKAKIDELSARVIKPDGNIIEVKNIDVYKKEIYNKDGRKVYTKSFSLPGLEVGCIIEMQWVYLDFSRSLYSRYVTPQQSLPVHKYVFLFDPYPNRYRTTTARGFPLDLFKELKGDKEQLELSNLPALPDYDYMIPRYDRQIWLFIDYRGGREEDLLSWDAIAKKRLHDLQKRNDGGYRKIKNAVKEITAGLNLDEEKAKVLYYYCKDKIQNFTYGYYNMTEEEKDDAYDNNNPKDTFSHGYGTSYDIIMLYYNMLLTAGIDAELVRSANRSKMLFDHRHFHSDVLRHILVKVNLETGPILCDPGNPMLAFAQLEWYHESMYYMRSKDKKAEFIYLPSTKASGNLIRRKADFTLDKEGTLRGSVEMIYHGQYRVINQDYYDEYHKQERIDMLSEELEERIPSVNVLSCSVTNVYKSMEPFTVKYEIEIPSFAEKTGKRFFLKTNFFEIGEERLFKEETRDMPIYIRLGKLYKDSISIELPQGYEIENLTAPGSVVDSDLITHKMKLRVDKEAHKIELEREYRHEAKIFSAKVYSKIRELFRKIYEQDNHEIVLKKI